MIKYNTKQKKEIMKVLIDSNEALTVKDILEELVKSGIKVGMTTVYRFLETLVEEKQIKKTIENNEAKYLLIEEDNLNGVYLKCEGCDELFFFECGQINKIKKHLEADHHITLDFVRSSILGTCPKCNKQQKKK